MTEEKYLCGNCGLPKLKSEMSIYKNKDNGVGINCKKCHSSKIKLAIEKRKKNDWWSGWFDKK
jgi:transcription elongation factor Elf1